MKRKILLVVLPLLLSILCFAQNKPGYWGSLNKGKYNSSFKRFYTNNKTRQFTDSCQDKTTITNRPEIVNVWYPTSETTGNILTIKDLMTFNSKNELYKHFDNILTENHYNLAILYTYADTIGDVFEPPVIEWKEETKKKFQKYYDLQTGTFSNAEIAEGKFPVIIYHQGLGATVEDQFLFCEYLASQGFIVANTAYQNYKCDELTIDWDLDISFNDIDFLINFIDKNITNSDVTKLIGVGHSYGAQAMLAYASIEANRMLGLILFDSTIDYEETYLDPRLNKLKDRIYPKKKNINKPMLCAAGIDATFKIIDSLNQCERWYIKIPNMNHEDYTSQVAVAKYLQIDGSQNPELSIPYENHLFQIQTAHHFINYLLNKEPFSPDYNEAKMHGIVFEKSTKGEFKY